MQMKCSFFWTTLLAVASQSESDKDLFRWADFSSVVLGWDLLSAAEWHYLINSRPGTRFAKACVRGVNGLILFPDSYRHPIAQALNNINAGEVDYSSNTFTLEQEQWNQMERAGAIFLPAALFSGAQGSYWSSTTTQNGANAKRLQFSASELTTANDQPITNLYSVRLVKPATN